MSKERELENALIQSNAMLEAIENILDGKEVSDFMLSFSIVRRVDDLMYGTINRELREWLKEEKE